MSYYEIVSLSASVVALVVSFASLYWTSRQARVTAAVAERQLQSMDREEAAARLAHPVVKLVNGGCGSGSVLITNEGAATPRDVALEFKGPDPLLRGGLKLPAPFLRPSQQLRLVATFPLESPPAYTARVSWRNPDGSEASEEYYLARSSTPAPRVRPYPLRLAALRVAVLPTFSCRALVRS